MRLFFVNFLLFICGALHSQVSRLPFTLEVAPFYGSILEHDDSISHLITDHPSGFILSFNQKTYGFENWQTRYNYPDYGVSYIKQNLKNSALGKNAGLYGHLNFYFLKRYLMLRFGQGIAHVSKPYDKESNYRNNAYGTRLLSSSYVMLQLKKEHIYRGLGVSAGASLIHYSNANIKAPNASTNTLALNFGVNYLFRYKHNPIYRTMVNDIFEKERVKYNVVFRAGVNESDIVGSGQFPFFVFSAYADKRLGHISGVNAGVDIFWSQFLKEHIKYKAIAYPERNLSEDVDFKRVGVFVGHELYINKLSFLTQIGFYAYYPYNDFEGRIYNRLGLKYYFSKKVFTTLSLKAHMAKAEALEFGLGIRI